VLSERKTRERDVPGGAGATPHLLRTWFKMAVRNVSNDAIAASRHSRDGVEVWVLNEPLAQFAVRRIAAALVERRDRIHATSDQNVRQRRIADVWDHSPARVVWRPLVLDAKIAVDEVDGGQRSKDIE
jgi:hypothetical protein